LRTSALSNCTGGISAEFPAGNPDVCTNNVFISPADNNQQQHMTTFTLGLGADGMLNYTTDYDTATSGDFYDLKKGLGSPTANWPDPIANTDLARIDDLWHAAVNGRGAYFSAKNPDDIIDGLTRTLTAITAKLGSAAAAATSTLNPVPGNNFAYVASYTTVTWKGNLESRSVNTITGEVSKTANWCVEDITASTCSSPNTIVADSSGSSTVYNCVAANATAGACTSPGVFDSVALTCSTPMANACTGTMSAKVAAATDTRTIYTPTDAGTALTNFDASYAATHTSYFDAARIGTLSQWATLDASQRSAATGENLLNFLRGQTGFEDRTSNLATKRLYRYREAVLGDALESQPAFMAKPVYKYIYPGYSDYVTAQASRAGTVYMGTNDGMLHAFASDTGIERWAYVPSMVIPNMWKLADTSYSTNHRNYVNGSPITNDICTADCTLSTATWKTILVGGLNGGGRGYYALDITNPATPTLLWEFTPSTGIGKIQDDDLGYSYGLPIITRKADGTWVVLVTSGFNNTSPGSGRGYLYVLDAGTGTIISKISTGVGDTTTPSGLNKVAVWNDEAGGNKAGYVYGGDLLGNLWRFDINSATAATIGTGDKLKFATLFSNVAATIPQPITTTPILAEIEGKRVIIVGTGKYLETSDLSNANTQSLYAIKDHDETSTLVNPRTTLVNQTLVNNIDGTATRTSSGNTVDFINGRGWYIDLPDISTDGVASERVNIDGKLVQGTLLIATIVPSSTVCSPGGYGWLNYLNYKTGAQVGTSIVSEKFDATIVGINVLYIDGKPIISVVTSDDPTPKKPLYDVPFDPLGNKFQGKRSMWRELIPQ
jgi:type IV pilus assembly protein PilY1